MLQKTLTKPEKLIIRLMHISSKQCHTATYPAKSILHCNTNRETARSLFSSAFFSVCMYLHRHTWDSALYCRGNFKRSKHPLSLRDRAKWEGPTFTEIEKTYRDLQTCICRTKAKRSTDTTNSGKRKVLQSNITRKLTCCNYSATLIQIN